MKSRFLLLMLIFIANVNNAAETALGHEGVQAALLSPDGSYFVIVNRRDREDTLFVIDSDEASAVVQRTFEAPDRILSTNWLDADSLIVQLGSDDDSDIHPRASGVVEIIGLAGSSVKIGRGAEGTTNLARSLVDAQISTIDSLPQLTGKGILYAENTRGLFVFDLDEDELERIDHPFIAVPKITSSPSQRILLVKAQTDLDAPVQWFASVESGAGWMPLPVDLEPINVSDAGLLLAIHRGNSETSKLVYVRLGLEGAQTLVANDSSQVLYQDEIHDFDRVVTGPNGAPVAVRILPGYPSWSYLQQNSGISGIHKSLVAAMPNSDVMIVSQSIDGLKLMVRVTNDSGPPEYLLVDAETGRVQRLLESQIGLALVGGDPSSGYSLVPFMVNARSGAAVFGYVSAPNDIASESRPTMVMIRSDYPESKWEWEFDEDVWFFNRLGFNVLLVNHAGTPGYGPLFSVRDQSAAVSDIEDAISWATENGLASIDTMCSFGRHEGASLALYLAMTVNSFQCAITAGPITDTLQSTTSSADVRNSGSLEVLAIIGSNESDEDRTRRVQLIQGLSQSNIQVEQFEVPGNIRSLGGPSSEILVLTGISRFVRQILPSESEVPVLPLTHDQAVELAQVIDRVTRRNLGATESRTGVRGILSQLDGSFRNSLQDEQLRVYSEISNLLASILAGDEPQMYRDKRWLLDPSRFNPSIKLMGVSKK